MISSFMQYNLLKRMKAGNFTQAEATANDVRHQAIAIANLGLYIVCIVLFIMWFRRAYNNLNLSERARTKYSDGWAAGAWFVPFLNLGRPFLMMQEIWEKTQEATHNLINYKSGKIIGWWWGIWIVNNIGTNFINRYFKESNIEEIITSTMATLIFNFIEMIALVLIIIIVKNVAAFENNLQQSLMQVEETESEDKLNFLM
ncbi:MAG: DUF4328 domain-containing protein [Ferruginibacter sp.]